MSLRMLFGLGLAGCMAVTAALAQEQPRFDGVTLRVATWGGSWRDNLRDIVAAGLESRGAKVEMIVGTPQDHLAKLIAARGQATPPFDVVELSDNNRQDWMKAGFLADLNYGNIPNAKSIEERFRSPKMVSTTQSQDGIAWNTEKFREAGIPEPKSYADLMNPKLKGYVAFPDITTVHAIKAITSISYQLGGTEADVDQALRYVKGLGVQLYWKSSVDLLAKFKSGDIWAAPWHVGWVVRGREAGVPLAMAWPKIGNQSGTVTLVWIGVIRNSNNARAAEYLINQYLDAVTQEVFATATGVIPQSAAAAAKLLEKPMLKEVMKLTPEERASLYYPDFDKIDPRDWTNRWNRQVLQ